LGLPAPLTLRCWLRRLLLLARGEHPAHNWRIHLVLALADVAGIVFHAQDKDRQQAFLVEILIRHGHRKHAVEAVLAICGLVAMLSHVPGKDANLIKVVGQAVVRFGDDAQILRNLLVGTLFAGVLYLVQDEEGDKALPFGILSTSSGTSTSTMRASTQPTRFCGSRTSHQSSSTGPEDALPPEAFPDLTAA